MAKESLKVIVFFLTFCLYGLNISAQQRQKWEFERNLPVYADSLISDWTFPLSYANAGISDFDEWRRTARQKVFDCMLTPPPPPAGQTEVRLLSEEQRDGYKAQKLEIRLSRYYWPVRVRCSSSMALRMFSFLLLV